MKRFLLAVAVLVAPGLVACNKPTEDECRQAIGKVQNLFGTEAAARNADNEGEVRRCRGGSTKDTVACAIKANTVAELKACAFMSAKSKP